MISASAKRNAGRITRLLPGPGARGVRSDDPSQSGMPQRGVGKGAVWTSQQGQPRRSEAGSAEGLNLIGTLVRARVGQVWVVCALTPAPEEADTPMAASCLLLWSGDGK